MYRLDHILVAVTDLEGAAQSFFDRYGLASYEGGRHAGLGTGNRIVPLGDSYVELLGVVDDDAAAASLIGAWIGRAATPTGRIVSWCLCTDDIEAAARRIGRSAQSMRRTRPDGAVLSWRSVGFEWAMDFPGLPFFITWEIPADEHPGRTPVPHRAEVKGITSVTLGGDGAELRDWLGDHDLPVRFSGGPPGIESVAISTASGPIEIS